MLRSNSNDNNYVHIVTHYLLEMSKIESSFCGECDKVCREKHSHTGPPEVYKNDNKIDLKDLNTLTRSESRRLEETNSLIHGKSQLSSICDQYKERILYWTKYFKQNFLGCKYEISAHDPYYKISSYPLWYQNKHNEKEIKTTQKILKDAQNPINHRYKCAIIESCSYETNSRDDAEKHMRKYHFTELTNHQLVSLILIELNN